MNVKQLLFDNVRGRVKVLLWTEIDKLADKAEQEASDRGEPLDEAGRIRVLYKLTKELYKKYEPLLKEMEKEERAGDKPSPKEKKNAEETAD